MIHLSRIELLCLLVLSLSGCTIINVNGASRVTQIRPGILRIEPAKDAHLVVYRSQGIGIIPRQQGITVGVHSEIAGLIYSPEDCRLVIFEPKEREVQNIVNLLEKISPKPNSICTVGEK